MKGINKNFKYWVGDLTVISQSECFKNRSLLSSEMNDFIQKQHLLIKKYDLDLLKHNILVAELTCNLAKTGLNFTEHELQKLYFSGLIHDIGKVFLSRKLLNTKGKLSLTQFKYIKEHTIYGARYIKQKLSKNNYFREKHIDDVVFNIKHHHEKLDGSGYPSGLIGEEIPFPTQIITIADVFIALKESRSYKQVWNTKRVLEHLEQNVPSKFNEKLFVLLSDLVLDPNVECLDKKAINI